MSVYQEYDMEDSRRFQTGKGYQVKVFIFFGLDTSDQVRACGCRALRKYQAFFCNQGSAWDPYNRGSGLKFLPLYISSPAAQTWLLSKAGAVVSFADGQITV
jgi:hypothetical protein